MCGGRWNSDEGTGKVRAYCDGSAEYHDEHDHADEEGDQKVSCSPRPRCC